MVYLLRETVFGYVKPEVEVLSEGAETKTKNYYLSGIFMQTETVNRNRRVYPRNVMENEINRYLQDVKEKKASALGELGHPETPNINMPLASHLITDLHFEGNNIIGKAKILPYTPNGKIVEGFINDGIVLGMSSRGLGSVKEQNNTNIVQDDFKLSTVDIVATPSAPEAFVNGILEGKEWLFLNGNWTEMHMEKAQKTIKSLKAEHVEEVALLIFENWLKKLKI